LEGEGFVGGEGSPVDYAGGFDGVFGEASGVLYGGPGWFVGGWSGWGFEVCEVFEYLVDAFAGGW